MHSLRVKHMRSGAVCSHNMRVGVRTVHCAVGRCRALQAHQAHLSHRAGVSQGMVRMVRTQAGGLVCCVASSSSSSSSSSSADDIIVPPLKTHIGAFETSLSSLMGLAHEHGYFAGEGVPPGVIDGSGVGLDAWLATRGGYAATKRALAQLARQHETEGNVKPVDDVHAQSLAALSCPAPNRKAANAHKRLRAWAGLEPQHPSQGPYEPGDAMGNVGLSDVLRLVLCHRMCGKRTGGWSCRDVDEGAIQGGCEPPRALRQPRWRTSTPRCETTESSLRTLDAPWRRAHDVATSYSRTSRGDSRKRPKDGSSESLAARGDMGAMRERRASDRMGRRSRIVKTLTATLCHPHSTV